MRLMCLCVFMAAAATPAAGCWNDSLYEWWWSLFEFTPAAAAHETVGLVLTTGRYGNSDFACLDDNLERASFFVSISDAMRGGYLNEHSSGAGPDQNYSYLYVYDVADVDGDMVTVGPLINAIYTSNRLYVDDTGWHIDPDKISPITVEALVADRDRVLCSLEEISTGTVTLQATEMVRVFTPPSVGGIRDGQVYKYTSVMQLLIEKIDSSEFTTVTKVDFSRCNLTVTGTELPLTPLATISTVDVITEQYRNPSVRYRARTAVQSQILSVPQGDSGELINADRQTVSVSAASLVLSDNVAGSDTFTAQSVQMGTTLPIFGRYGISPEGYVPGDEATYKLLLTAGGFRSDMGDGTLIVIVPPGNATGTITITGTERPER